MTTVEFFFDYSCPYAYLASTQIEAICQRTGAALVWRPMLLGGVFRELGAAQNQASTMSPQKAQHNVADMHRWASLWSVPLSMPDAHPMRTVEALRATLAAPKERLSQVIHSLYRAYWVEHQNMTERAVIVAALTRAGVDGEAVVSSIDQTTKDQLKANTDEALARGVFGAPSVFVGDQMYWGQDRLWMVEQALGGTPRQPGEGAYQEPASPFAVDFYFDFSSPFAYLASTQMEALCARRRAKLNWRPMLLGGVFKALGGPIVPLETFSPPKQRYQGVELERWANHWKVPFAWPTRFPMKTVKALRIALSLGEEALPYIARTFRAYWAEDLDIDDESVLKMLLEESGFDSARASAAEDPLYKKALIDATQAAVDAGVFGAPTSIVGGHLFWGQDRLFLVERVLEGWGG
jgi:2-hydroxychromene-2-carboxylate isomerase